MKRGVEAADAQSTALEPGVAASATGNAGADGRAQLDGYLEARHSYHRRAALLQGLKMGQLHGPVAGGGGDSAGSGSAGGVGGPPGCLNFG